MSAPRATGTFVRASRLALDAAHVWNFHARPGAFARLMPPWQRLAVRSMQGTLKDARLRFDILGPMGVRIPWHARHDEQGFVDGERFVDVMDRGPASYWRHRHTVRTLEPGACELHDHIDYRLPAEPVGRWLGGAKFRADLERMFTFRHARTLCDARRHARFAHAAPLRVVVTGSAGMIGAPLVAYLCNAGHTVDRLVRRAPEPTGDGTALLPGREARWDPQGSEPSREMVALLDGADAVVHLAGAPVGDGRIGPAQQRAIIGSRLAGTAQLVRALRACRRPPATLLCASGTGIYRPAPAGDRAPRDEGAPLGDSWLARLAQDWERAASEASPGTRVVQLRIGVVLGSGGGFLRALTGGLAGVAGALGVAPARLGAGDQVLPWVHIDDVLGAIEHALHTPALVGPVNVCAPATDDCATLLRATSPRAWLRVPAGAGLLRALRGAGAEAVLASLPVAPRALSESGYCFVHTHAGVALGVERGRAEALRAWSIAAGVGG